MNKKSFLFVFLSMVTASASLPAALVTHFDYSGQGAGRALKAVVGAAGAVFGSDGRIVSGTGAISNTVDTVWIPRGTSLRVPLGYGCSSNEVDWCLALKVRLPDNSGKAWHSFYSFTPQGDGALFLDPNARLGANRRWGGYAEVPWQDEKWHTLAISVSATDGMRSLFFDNKLVKVEGLASGVKRFELPYLYIGGDDNGDDGLMGIGEIRIWDEAYPKALFPKEPPTVTYSAMACRVPQKLATGVPIAEIVKSWEANASAPHPARFEFDEQGEFIFLHVTDIQEDRKLHSLSAKVLQEAVRRFKPQLAVVTGDNVGASYNRNNFIWTIEAEIAAFRENKLPFCMTFGNHDTGHGHERQWQYDLFRQAGGQYFVDHDVPELTGGGNGFVDICLKGEKQPAFRLYVMDSCAYAGKGYDGCHSDQIAWFERVRGNIPYLWFQHIVVPEINTTGILKDGKIAEGVLGEKKENPCPTIYEAYTNGEHTVNGRTLYQSWRESGCHRGAYFGHDHKNTFDGVDNNGIRMGYSKALTLCSYNDGNPGLRVFKLKRDGSFTTFSFTARDLDPK